jgi:hypothetical protein
MLFKTRYNILSAVLVLYLAPLAALSYFSAKHSSEVSWGVFCFALFLLSAGSLILFLLLRYWENESSAHAFALDGSLLPLENSINTIQLEEFQKVEERILQMETELNDSNAVKERKQEEIGKMQQALTELGVEKDLLQDHVSALLGELNQIKEASEEKLEQNQIFLNEHQQTITEQRHAIEVKQQHIQQLEDKVRDLTYEIKTLLHLAEKTQLRNERDYIGQQDSLIKGSSSSDRAEMTSFQPPQGQISQEAQATQQLRHCIDIAQKMTGASHYQNRVGQKSELSIEHYALDLRCLFESLRSETSCAIMIYSQKENKLIFGNNQIKPLLGWTAEKFIQNFPSIIGESTEIWSSSLAQLAYKNECQAELLMRSKGGPAIPVKCYFGVIPTGIFRSNILGLLLKSEPCSP